MPTARRLGGPTLISHDWTAPDAPCHSVIARYDLEQAKIDSLLATIRQNGAGSIGISPWLMQGAADDLYLAWSNARLAPRFETNFLRYLSQLKAQGFTFILVAPQFYAQNDVRQPATTAAALAQNIDWILNWLRPALDANGVPYLIDLCTEGAGDIRCVDYCKRLWSDYTAKYWPNGVCCWDATFSMRADTSDNSAKLIAGFPDLFRGTNPDGPVNCPGILNFHVYADANGHILPALQAIQTALAVNRLPPRALVLGETNTLLNAPDMSVAGDLANFADIWHGQPLIEGVFSWPVPVGGTGSGAIQLVPSNYDYWRAWGF